MTRGRGLFTLLEFVVEMRQKPSEQFRYLNLIYYMCFDYVVERWYISSNERKLSRHANTCKFIVDYNSEGEISAYNSQVQISRLGSSSPPSLLCSYMSCDRNIRFCSRRSFSVFSPCAVSYDALSSQIVWQELIITIVATIIRQCVQMRRSTVTTEKIQKEVEMENRAKRWSFRCYTMTYVIDLIITTRKKRFYFNSQKLC